MAIAKLMLEAQHYRFNPDAEKAFQEYIVQRKQIPHFANARSIRNALERDRLRLANRLFVKSDKQLTKKDLITIEAEDILASRVFNEGVPDNQKVETAPET